MNHNHEVLFVIFGVSGDLAKRKLLPALYRLVGQPGMAEEFKIIGISRQVEFGVDDEGVAVGLADPVAECLRIENMINDSLDPAPRYTLERDEAEISALILSKLKRDCSAPLLARSVAMAWIAPVMAVIAALADVTEVTSIIPAEFEDAVPV